MDTYAVIGGGIAGVSCAQELERLHGSMANIVLVTNSDTITGVGTFSIVSLLLCS
jgi:glycine/D-amino acid oxidase-like deaminating enzyme